MAIKQKKGSIHATVSPYIRKKAEELVESEEFSSMSDLVNIALSEFVEKYYREQKPDTPSKAKAPNVADALTKAGIAHVEAGEIEEAKRCFAKARELEGQPSKQNPGRISYGSQKEREAWLLNEMNPNPRELTPEEERKAAEAKKRTKALFPEDEEGEENSSREHILE